MIAENPRRPDIMRASRVRWSSVLGTGLLAAIVALAVLWIDRERLATELDLARHPREATVRVTGARAPVDVTWRLTRSLDLAREVGAGASGSIRVTPGTTASGRLPAGVVELSAADRTLPVLLLAGAELTWDLTPAPPGFVRIPAGPYLAELSPTVAWAKAPDGTRHGDGYLVSLTEVTVGDYAEFLAQDRGPTGNGEGAAADRASRPHGRFCSAEELHDFPGGCTGHVPAEGTREVWSGLDRPASRRIAVRWVSWYDALAFCRWKTREAAHAGRRLRFRLPTRSEWEKAARGVDGRPFPWGFDPGHVAQRVLVGGRLDVESHPELRSPYGLFHAGSSVAEWTLSTRGAGRRVVMGRTWDPHTDRIHLGYGAGEPPRARLETVGFRLVAEELE